MPVTSMIVVDASVWVARLIPQDRFHRSAKAWMADRLAEGTLLLSPSMLLPEVAGAIAGCTEDRELAAKTIASLQRLPGLRLVEMDHNLVSEAAHLASSLGLRGADAVYVAAAAYLNLPFCTLDEDLARRAAHQVTIHSIFLNIDSSLPGPTDIKDTGTPASSSTFLI